MNLNFKSRTSVTHHDFVSRAYLLCKYTRRWCMDVRKCMHAYSEQKYFHKYSRFWSQTSSPFLSLPLSLWKYVQGGECFFTLGMFLKLYAWTACWECIFKRLVIWVFSLAAEAAASAATWKQNLGQPLNPVAKAKKKEKSCTSTIIIIIMMKRKGDNHDVETTE